MRNDTVREYNRYYEMSAPGTFFPSSSLFVEWPILTSSSLGFKQEVDRITAASGPLEQASHLYYTLLRAQQYNWCRFLKAVVEARRALPRREFRERFAGESEHEKDKLAEYFLRVAMAQQIVPEAPIERDREWQYFDLQLLDTPIPGFPSAYGFYETYDWVDGGEPSGFYYVPIQSGTKEKCGWVPLQVSSVP